MLAVMHGKIACVERLIQTGANILMFGSLCRKHVCTMLLIMAITIALRLFFLLHCTLFSIYLLEDQIDINGGETHKGEKEDQLRCQIVPASG